MNYQTILDNFRKAFQRLLALRIVVSSPAEKIADLPAVYGILAIIMVPAVCVGIFILGLIFRYRIRLERDAEKRYA